MLGNVVRPLLSKHILSGFLSLWEGARDATTVLPSSACCKVTASHPPTSAFSALNVELDELRLDQICNKSSTTNNSLDLESKSKLN